MSKLTLAQEADRRRTFAIIAHPDAGKTTLTEHILLAGGAVRAAGAVKARGENRRARSDWMKIEKERGISVTASVMTFEHDGKMFNLLDTPGHEDFSEDTYRTLTAVDSAVMVIDAAKGIERAAELTVAASWKLDGIRELGDYYGQVRRLTRQGERMVRRALGEIYTRGGATQELLPLHDVSESIRHTISLQERVARIADLLRVKDA